MRCLVPSSALALSLLLASCSEPPSSDAPATAPDEAADDVARAKADEEPAPSLGSASPSEPVPTNGRGGGVLKTVRFPGGEVAFPVGWGPKVRDEPPMTAVHVTPAPAMTCDLAVLEGHGTKKQAEEYLAAGANAFNGDTVRAPGIDVGGLAFQGIHITKPKALPDNATALVEVYAAISGDDLVGIGVTRLQQTAALDEGRRHCLQAFAQLTSKLPPAASP